MWHWWGMFPMVVMGIAVVLIILFLGRGRREPPCWRGVDGDQEGGQAETPLDVLKKRYARGEITKEEFEQIKKDIL